MIVRKRGRIWEEEDCFDGGRFFAGEENVRVVAGKLVDVDVNSEGHGGAKDKEIRYTRQGKVEDRKSSNI